MAKRPASHRRNPASVALQPYLELLTKQLLELRDRRPHCVTDNEALEIDAEIDTLCANLFQELSGKQLLVLRDVVNARLMEQLLGLLLAPQSGTMEALTSRAAEAVSALMAGPCRAALMRASSETTWMKLLLCDPIGSHVLQKLLWRLTEPDLHQAITGALVHPKEHTSDDGQLQRLVHAARAVADALESLSNWWFAPVVDDEPEHTPLDRAGCWFTTMVHPSGTHVLRAFLLVISALPARRFGPAQNWQTHALEQFLSGDQPVPTAPVCPALLVNKIIPSLTGLSVQALRRLMRYAPASATLQTLLLATVQVHRHHCDASDDGDETNGTETSGSRVRRHYGYQLIALFLGAAREDLLTGPAASRLLELTLRCACAWSNSTERGSSPDIRNLLEAFYAKHMSGAERLRRLYLHPRANYCVQGLLYSANSGLVQRMLVDDALLEHLEASKRATHPEPRHDRSGVLCAVLRAVLRASVASDAALTHLVQRTIAAAEQWVGVGAVDTQKATQHNVRCIMQTLFPNDDEYEPTGTQKRTRAVATSPAAVEASERAAARGSVNGSLLLQLLVHHSSAVLHAFTQLDLPELLTIAKDMVACHALLAYLDAMDARQAERIQTRAQLYRCIPRVLELANSASGSRFLEKAARFMQQDLVWQRKVTEQLAPALTMLAGTHHGARCIRLFQVRLWLDYPQLWLSTRRKQASVKRVLSEILESDTNDGSLSRPSRDHRASTRASAKGHPLNAASAFLHSGSSDGCSLDQNAELERPQKKPSLLASDSSGDPSCDAEFYASLARLDPLHFTRKDSSCTTEKRTVPAVQPLPSTSVRSTDLAPVLEAIHRASTAKMGRTP